MTMARRIEQANKSTHDPVYTGNMMLAIKLLLRQGLNQQLDTWINYEFTIGSLILPFQRADSTTQTRDPLATGKKLQPLCTQSF